MRQSACLVINPITVDNFASLINCTPGGWSCIRLSDGPNIKLVDLSWLGLDLFLSVAWSLGVQLVFFLFQYFSGVVLHPRVLQVSQYVSVESSSLTHQRPYS